MSRWDTSRNAVSGPQRIAELASFFEAGGMPFHAWCVVQGTNASLEASMAASVLAAGARSLSIDLESYPGFWAGTSYSALQYTGMLRQAQPNATVMISIDARPWEFDRIPLREFAAAANAIAPQVYWSDFATPPNITKYRLAGADPGASGVTPLFALDTAARRLAALGLPIHPIGPGLIADEQAWGQFMTESFARDVEALSVWRFGTTSPYVLDMLQANPPRPRSYVVQRGDVLGQLASAWNTTVADIVRMNGITNPNFLIAGQVLTIPRGAAPAVVTPTRVAAPAIAPAPTAAAAPVSPPAPRTYTVQPGDSVGLLAERWDTTSRRIVEANGLSNVNIIVVGQQLRIP